MAEDLPPKLQQSGSSTEPRCDSEPLKAISGAELESLLDILREGIPRDICAEGLVKNAIQWSKNRNTLVDHQIYAPFGDFKNGACISVFNIPEISYQSLNFYCRDPEESKMLDALDKTKLIHWGANGLFKLFSVSEHLLPIIDELVCRKNLEHEFSHRNDLLWMDKERARTLQVQCPPGVKLEKLTLEQIDYLDDYWPYHFEGSKHLWRIRLECNFGLGVFLPSTELPVAWAMVCESLSIGMLFVLPSHRRRGYAQLLCSAIARKLCEMDVDSYGTIQVENHASRKMFESLGFKIKSHCYYMGLRPKQA